MPSPLREAETAYRRSLEILVQHFDPNKPEVKTVMENLNEVYQSMEKGPSV